MNFISNRKMVVFDSAYTYEMMIARKMDIFAVGRDLDGYFDFIWSVHPVASLFKDESEPERYGKPITYVLSSRHLLIEGKVGRFSCLKFIPVLNFILAQISLIIFLLKLFFKNDIKIIRAEDPYYNGILAYIFSRIFRLPLMIGVWGNPGNIRLQTKKPIMPRFFRFIFIEELIEKFILLRANLVLVQNEDNRNFVLQKGVSKKNTWIFSISNVLHQSHWIPPFERVDGSNDLLEFQIGNGEIALCISRLEKLKHVDHLIYVIRILRDSGRNVFLFLVGEGSFRDDLQELAITLGVSDKVIFCGNRDQEWISRVLPKVNVVISPLTGRALGEAALGGAPIVAYDVDWHSEIVIPNITGILVPYLDYQKLAQAVEELLKNPKIATQLGKNMRNFAIKYLSPNEAIKNQINAYESII